MSVSVTFNGNSYSVPEDEETGWEDLTDLLVALAQNAATTSAMSFSVRTATTTPQTLQATDTTLLMNVGSASVVNVPTGVQRQFYAVFDISGAADTNPITVTPSGGQLINGQATYVIRSPRGGLLMQFDGTGWRIISEVTAVLKAQLRIENDTTNTAFVGGAVSRFSTPVAAADGFSASASFGGSESILVAVGMDSGESLLLHTSKGGTAITALSDPSGIFLTADLGVGVFVSKAAGSSTVTFKNRMGGPKNIEIKALTNRLTGATVWA